MAFVEVSSKSWFTRIGESIKSVLVGIVFFLVSFPLLFWNEGRAVQTAKSLGEGASAVVSVASDKVDASREGKLVHTTGEAKTDETLNDDAFGVEAPAIKLTRNVEMYQWKEKKESKERKTVGGGSETVTSYNYEKVWAAEPINSRDFKESGHDNPGRMPFKSETWTARNVTLGAFTLSPEQISQIGGSEPRAMTDGDLGAIPEETRDRARLSSGGFFFGGDPATPAVGDTRVRFEVTRPHAVSVVAVQMSNSFARYQAAAGDAILLVADGTQSAAEMFKAAQDANTLMTWLIRAGGFLLMFIGLLLGFKPISTFGDVVPLFGSLLAAGLGAFSFLLSLSLTTVTVGIAWVVYRPILGIVLLLAAAGSLVLLVMRGKARTAATAPRPA